MASLILNSKRSSMSPYRAHMLSFIHDNYGKFYPITQEKRGMVKTAIDSEESDSD